MMGFTLIHVSKMDPWTTINRLTAVLTMKPRARWSNGEHCSYIMTLDILDKGNHVNKQFRQIMSRFYSSATVTHIEQEKYTTNQWLNCDVMLWIWSNLLQTDHHADSPSGAFLF